MPRNGSGGYSLPEPPFVTGTSIDPTPVNSDFSDIAQALTGSVAADGQTPMTGDLNLNGHGINGLAGLVATALTVNGNASITGTLAVTKNATFSANVAATGTVKSTSGTSELAALKVTTNMTVTGNGTFGGALTSSTGTTSLAALSVATGATVTANLAVGASATIGNDLAVVDDGSFGGTVTAANGTSGFEVVNYGQFPGTKAASGYFGIPTGWFVQSGSGAVVGSATVTFPALFSTLCTAVTATADDTNPVIVSVSSRSLSGFVVKTWDQDGNPVSANITWIATGY